MFLREALRCAEAAGYVGIDTSFDNNQSLLELKMFFPGVQFNYPSYYVPLSSLSQDCVRFYKDANRADRRLPFRPEVFESLQAILNNRRIKKVFFDGHNDLKALRNAGLCIQEQEIINIERLNSETGIGALYISYDLEFPCPSSGTSSDVGPCYDAIYLPYIAHKRKTRCQDQSTGKLLDKITAIGCSESASDRTLSTANNKGNCPYFDKYGQSMGVVAGVGAGVAVAGAAVAVGLLLREAFRERPSETEEQRRRRNGNQPPGNDQSCVIS